MQIVDPQIPVMREAYINLDCPVCGSKGDYWHSKNGYNIDKCGHCGFVYVRNVLSDKDLSEFYGNGYQQADGGFVPHYTLSRRIKYWILGKWIGLVARKDKIKLLEIGCSQGYLLEAVRNNARFEAEGIDYAEGPINYARSSGLKVNRSSLEDMRYAAELFDFIVALHVIEHVQNLNETFREIRRVLKPGGYVYIVLPCISHFKARLAGRRWHYIGPPGHLWYFTTQSMRVFLEQRGFSVVMNNPFSNRGHLRVLAKKR